MSDMRVKFYAIGPTLAALAWGLERWPDKDLSAVANQLIRSQWPARRQLMQYATLRRVTPVKGIFSRWYVRSQVIGIANDVSSDPRWYLENLDKTGITDRELDLLLNTPAKGAFEAGRQLPCEICLEEDTRSMCDDFAAATNRSQTDSINNLLQFGHFLGQFVAEGWSIEYQSRGESKWLPLSVEV